MCRRFVAVRRIADTQEFNNSLSRRAIAQFPPRSIWRENQLDQCAQLTKKRVKSGITDATKTETPPYGGSIEIKDRAEISGGDF